MRTPSRRLAAIARPALATLAVFAIAAPASSQVGSVKKNAKEKAAQEGMSKAADAATGAPSDTAEAAVPGGQGGMIVLTADVVNQLLAGLKAGQAERETAAKEDTPYGRYQKAQTAYAVAKPKCEAGQQAFQQGMAGNQKLLDKYSALTEKLLAAQGKGDQKLAAVYYDSLMAMQDPSCVVKQPQQPDDYYQAQRDIEARAEKQEIKASGFSQSDLAMVKERAIAILQGATPPGGASPTEKSAVSAKSTELKPLLGFADQPTARAMKPAPTPAPAATPGSPQMPPAASSMSDCVAKNAQSHQTEIEALGTRAQAAQAAGDMAALMAIADTLQRIQMAGCQGE